MLPLGGLIFYSDLRRPGRADLSRVGAGSIVWAGLVDARSVASGGCFRRRRHLAYRRGNLLDAFNAGRPVNVVARAAIPCSQRDTCDGPQPRRRRS
ncbi:hypothetical protein FAGKG844_100047 [Frankia sp. AgKG'84/4]